jgi:hypothetical protein
MILVDLDDDFDCAPALRDEWLRDMNHRLCFRVAVREIETWLLADRINLARFLSVTADLIPIDPEKLTDPKATLVRAATRSRRRSIREDIPPRQSGGRPEGPAYTSQLQEFVRDHWDVEQAMTQSISLSRCVERIRQHSY